MQVNIHLIVFAITLVNAALNEPCVGAGGIAGVCVKVSACTASGGTTTNNACPRDAADVKCCTKRACGTPSSAESLHNEHLQQPIISDKVFEEQQPISREEPFHAEEVQEEFLDEQDQSFPSNDDERWSHNKPIPSEDVSAHATGNCRWKSDCAGRSFGTVCPGPNEFMCCTSSAPGFGGYKDAITHFGRCEQAAINGARKIIQQFPGRVREVYCIRDCRCDGNGSDHCCGMATDMMCSDAGGRPTMSGQEIAEWIMRNRVSLRLKYVIWGQKIWDVRRDTVKPWSQWQNMDDRGDITQNHWDHVHVSYR